MIFVSIDFPCCPWDVAQQARAPFPATGADWAYVDDDKLAALLSLEHRGSSWKS
jgi:hypothetical protein